MKAGLMYVIWVVLLYEARNTLSSKLVKDGKNVCIHRQSVTVYSTKQKQVTTLQTYTTCCSKFLFCWKKCKRSRPVSKTVTVTVSEMRHEEVYHCCEGYTVDASGTQCSTPVCDPPCENGGKCTDTGVCKCPSGFEGRLCQNDINECNIVGEHECSQRCINIPGSYLCACNRGFVPGDPASKTCKDINECKQLSVDGRRTGPCRCIGAKCENSCQNTIGSYICSCGDGYRLLWDTCVDRNECVEKPDICPHKCINTPGSYRCECWEGFRYNSNTRQCEEIDECSIGNGGCEHICHSAYGRHTCSCRRGFFLAADRFSCTDINECQWTTRCDPQRSHCINTPGSYYCKCKTGFKFLQSHGICLDRDECKEKTALCNQKCFNTIGSYKCGCNAGYYLDTDLKTCKDVDECRNKPCDQICVNTPGSYKCFCNQGYTLDYDEKSCIPKYCQEIQAPFFGKIDCEGFTVGKKCSFSCNEGYHIDNDVIRVCQSHGKWSNNQPKCVPNSCGQPRPPANGKLLLPCDVSYGSTCPVTCVKGFVRRGAELIKCEIKQDVVHWDVEKVKCEEILVCKPNPCKHGGLCSIVSPTTYSCNCSGTGYEGKNCEIGFVMSERIPKLKKGETVIVKYKAKPERKIQLKFFPEDSSLKVSKESIEMTNVLGTAQVELTGTDIGLKLLSYQLVADEVYATPKPSMIIVYDPARVDAYRIEGLSKLIPSDCFSVSAQLTTKTCPDIKLVSNAPWFKRSTGLLSTNGIAVLNVAGNQFPLLLPGADQKEIFMDSNLVFKQNAKSASCRRSALTEGQLQYIGRYDVFSRDFIKAFNTLMPAWFQLKSTKYTKHFTENMARSFLATGKKVKEMKYCSAVAIDVNSVFAVHYIYEHLLLKIGAEELVMETKKAFCLAVDLCKKEAHIQLPESYGKEILGLLSFNELASFKWKANIKSVGFATTRLDDARSCLNKNEGENLMVFGGARLEYSNEHGVNSYANGVMAVGFKASDGKTIVDSSNACIDGKSLVESPSWISTNTPSDPYALEEHEDSDVVKITSSSVSPDKSVLSLEQHGGSVFKIKSGLRPLIKKSSRDIRFDISYKVSEKASPAHTDNNYRKYSLLESISFSLGDIDLELEMLYPPRFLAAKVNNQRAELKTLTDLLNNDLDELISDIDNSKLINEKVKFHHSKGKQIVKNLSNFLDLAKASIDADVFDRIQKAVADVKSTLASLGKGLKTASTVKSFESLLAHFNGSMCLFKPCIENVAVELQPQSIDSPWEGKCYDPSKTSFQMWDTNTKVLSQQHAGSFFTFAPGDKFHLCLSIYGIDKGDFNGRFNFLGNSYQLGFQYNDNKVTIPKFIAKIKGKYRFQVNATVETMLNRWDMMSAKVMASADIHSEIVQKLQRSMDAATSNHYQELLKRKQASESKLSMLDDKKRSLTGKKNHYKKMMKEAEESHALAGRIYRDKEAKYKRMLRYFAEKRTEYVTMKRRLDTICQVKPCYFQCQRIDNCTVCQKSIKIAKTIPRCRRDYENRTYSYKSNLDTMCSHVVEDRRLKYTGNCKRPQLEKHRAEQIINRLKRKQKKKEPFTLEDAWDLKLIDEKEGKKLEDAVRKQMFWRSFSDKLESASLIESDFKKIEKYTNATFAKRIRYEQRQIKLNYLWQELSRKLESGGRLNDEDIESIRKLNETFAAKLKVRLDINEKIESGKPPSKEELKLFEKLDPQSYGEFIKGMKREEARREALGRISRKLREGNLSADDLKELEEVDPNAAKKLKEGLKEQLKKKVSEMKAKLETVGSAISVGDKDNKFGKLNEKLSNMTKNLKPYDRNELKLLQDRIKKSVAFSGSVFDKFLERFDLALELQAVTGRSSEFQRSLKAFFSTLDKFNLHGIFLQRENQIVQSLGDLNKWFETLGSLLEKLCGKCGKSCDEGIIKRTMQEVRESFTKFQSKVCKKNGIIDSKQLCSSLSKVSSFVQRYDLMRVRDCQQIKQRLLPFIRNAIKDIKNLGRADADVFETVWKTSKTTKSIKKAYDNAVNGFKNALSSSSLKLNFGAPDFTVITTSVAKIARPGVYSIKEMEYLIAKETLTAFKDAIKFLPINTKQLSSKNLSISADKQTRLTGQFQVLLDRLTVSLLNLCSVEPSKSEVFAATDRRVKRVLTVAKNLFAKMLNEKDLLSFFRGSKNVGVTLEHALKMADDVKRIGEKCSNITSSPLRELESFLSVIRDFGSKSVDELAKDISSKIRSIGSEIKAPIGKLVNLVDQLAANVPEFDIPIIMSMGSDESGLLFAALKNYLKMIGDAFKRFVEISGKCKNCKIEEVLGDYNLKSIAAKLDRNLKPIAEKFDKFISSLGVAFKGTPLLFSSLEQIRTDLERIRDSQSSYDEKTFADITEGVRYAMEAVDLIEKGFLEFQVKVSGDKNDAIRVFIQELTNLKRHIFELYEKRKDPDLEKSIAMIKNALSRIPSAGNMIENLKKGAVNNLLDSLENTGEIVKKITEDIRKLYRSPMSRYIEDSWLPKVAKSLDEIERVKVLLVNNAEKLLINLGVLKGEESAKSEVKRHQSMKYVTMYKQLRSTAKNGKIGKAAAIAQRSQRGDAILKRITSYWRSAYESITGKIDAVKSRMLKLREKYERYVEMYRDIKNTVEEIQKGPVAEIGQVKDSLENLLGSVKDYNLKTLLVSEPDVFKKKIKEMRHLFQASGSAVKKVDDLIKKCKSCSIDKILGYKFIKNLAGNVEKTFSSYFEFLEEFGDKVTDGVKEVQDMNKVISTLRGRFQEIGSGNKKPSDSLAELGKALANSGNELDKLQGGVERFSEVLIGKDVDLQLLGNNVKSIAHQLGTVVNKSIDIAINAEDAYKEIKKVEKMLDRIHDMKDSIQKGSVNTRISVAKEASQGIKAAINALPKILKSSRQTLASAGINGEWVDAIESSISAAATNLDKIRLKTDAILNAAGIIVEGKENISDSLKDVKVSLKNLQDAPWDAKIIAAENISRAFDSFMDSSLQAIASSSSALGRRLTKEGLIKSLQDKIGKKRLENINNLSNKVSNVLNKLQKNVIPEVGKLTDAFDDYVEGLKDFDIKKALLSDSSVLEEKIGEFQDLADRGGDLLLNVAKMTDVCTKCSLEDILGDGFVKKISQDISKTFDKLYDDVLDISQRIKTGNKGVQAFLRASKDISSRFKGVIKNGKLSSDTFKSAAGELKKSAQSLKALKGASKDVFTAIFNDENDINELQASFSEVIDAVSDKIEKGGILSEKVEKAYKTVEDVKDTVKGISTNYKKISGSPLEVKAKLIQNMMSDVQEIFKAVPTFLEQSANVSSFLTGNTTWLDSLSSSMLSFNKKVESMFAKTDSLMKSAGLIATDISHIGSTSSEILDDIKQMRSLSVKEKFTSFKNIAKKVDDVFRRSIGAAGTFESAVKDLNGPQLNISEGIGKFGDSLSGIMKNVSKGIKFAEDLYNDIEGTVDEIKLGPVAKVGALTDSIENFVGSLNDYNLAEVMVQTPKFAKDKIGELKSIIKDSGSILGNMNKMLGKYCPGCNISDIFGSEFSKKVGSRIKKGFDRITGNLTKFLDKVAEGGESVLEIVNSVKQIETQVKSLDGIRFDSDGLNKISNVLNTTSGLVEGIGRGSNRLAEVLFEKNKALNGLTSKFQGLVGFVGGFMNSTGKALSGISDAVDRVEKIQDSFNAVKKGFQAVGEGPIESRLKAVENVANGLVELTSGVPDLMRSLGASDQFTTFVRGFGSKVNEIANGIKEVVNNTQAIAGDISQTIKSVNNIGKISKTIGNSFNRILRGSFTGKISAVKDMVNQVKSLTGEVNSAAGTISGAVNKLTGKSILKSPIFGQTTAKVLNDISGAVTLVADRYEKVQSLTKTVNKALKSISTDPVDFAVNDLPKLITQTDGLVSTLLNDTKGIAAKLGLQLEGLNLNPELVSASKEFFSFAKGAIGAIQSGKELFGNFKDLFTSKDFVTGMKNFQSVIKNSKKFMENLDGLGKQLFKEDWAGMKGDFQETLDKIGNSIGINFEKTGEIFEKISGSATDVLSIASDVKSLLNIKEFNLETTMKAAKAIVNIAKSTTNFLNRFGANIQTKALEKIGNFANMAMSVYQIGKGIYDFIKWINDVCDITYASDVQKKVLKYRCLKGQVKTMVMKIPLVKCEYLKENITRGFGDASFCCNGTKCLYIQNQACLRVNSICVQKRTQFVQRSRAINRELAAAYLQYENARQSMELAQIDMKSAELLRQRHAVTYNVSSSQFKRIDLEIVEMERNLASIKRTIATFKLLINLSFGTSRVRFINAEFNTILFSAKTSRIPLKVVIKDHTEGFKIIRFMMDFEKDELSIKQATEHLLRNLTDYSFARRRRSTEGHGKVKGPMTVTACAEFESGLNFLATIVRDLHETIISLPRNVYFQMRKTSNVRMSTNAFLAMRQLLQEIRQLEIERRPTLRNVIGEWSENTQRWIVETYKKECFDVNECIGIMIDDTSQLIDLSNTNNLKLVKKYKQIGGRLNDIFRNRFSKSTILDRLKAMENFIQALRYEAEFCHRPPALVRPLPVALTAYLGEELTLSCKVDSSSTNAQYWWYLNKTTLPAYKDEILRISNVTAEHEGAYYCKVQTEAGELETSDVFVTVKKRIEFLEPLQSVSIPKTSPRKVQLICNTTAEDDATYTWWYQSFNGQIRKLSGTSAMFVVSASNVGKNGVFWCEVTDGYMKLRSRKVVVAHVDSKRRLHNAMFDMQGVLSGHICNAPSVTAMFGGLIETKIVKGHKIPGYRSSVTFEDMLYKNEKQARFLIHLNWAPSGNVRITELDQASADAQVQYSVQKMANSFLDDREVVQINTSECNLVLMKSDANVDFDPPTRQCPAGMGLTSNRLRCETCLPGYFENGLSNCVKCPKGTYQPRFGALSCIPCGSGYLTPYTASLDHTSCISTDHKCYDKINLMLAVDSSNALKIEETKIFLKAFNKHFSTASTRISVVSFDSSARLLGYSHADSGRDFADLISLIKYRGDGRRTDLLLQMATGFFEAEYPGYRNVLFIVTHGSGTRNSGSIEGNIARMKELGVEIFYLDASASKQTREAMIISSSPKETHVITAAGSEVSKFSTYIAHSVCNSDDSED